MKYLYGPVQSRRLGLSLGITLTSKKVCSYDCIYCQLGKTTEKTGKRKDYVAILDILSELKEFFKTEDFKARPPGYISLSGFGEPTLNINIACLISEIKRLTKIPLALITNASLFKDKKVRQDVLGVDLLIPSLDAVTQEVFEAIDRPIISINVEDVISGLISLRKEFSGEIFLEIMLLKGINDSLDYAYKFKEVIDKINPDKVQLNVPVRAHFEIGKIPDKDRLFQVKDILGPKCEII